MRASLGWLQLDRYLASNFTDYLYDSALAQASLKTEHGSARSVSLFWRLSCEHLAVSRSSNLQTKSHSSNYLQSTI